MEPHLAAGPRERGSPGQALVEFALVSMLLVLLLGAVVEFGFLFDHKLELANAARAGARWGATHSTAWSAAATPPSNTIEGQVQAAGGTSTLANDDSHLLVEYLAVSGSSLVQCGHYSAGSGAFVAQAGYTQSTCVAPGNLVRVTLTNPYSLVTGLLGGVIGARVTVQALATMPVMS
ncbi:MAG TPA: TadE/TadG family type IV pilus assembly protein [Candidatus Dormibacteraeota bacterium]|nr:TadE/TadG family type IV pilus assembly protein [Candidatus Dormibacteraeota bacterium]